MRDEQRTARKIFQDVRKLQFHLPFQVRIERGKRLIEQHKLGLPDQNARQRAPLLLSAGKLTRTVVLQSLQAECVQNLPHRLLPLVFRAGVRACADVLLDRHVREQRVLLKQIADLSLLRRQVDLFVAVEQNAPIQFNMALIRPHDACDAPQRHALAAAGGTEQRHHFPLSGEVHFQVKITERFLDIHDQCHALRTPLSRFSSRLTASSTTAEMARLTTTHLNASASSFVRHS